MDEEYFCSSSCFFQTNIGKTSNTKHMLTEWDIVILLKNSPSAFSSLQKFLEMVFVEVNFSKKWQNEVSFSLKQTDCIFCSCYSLICYSVIIWKKLTCGNMLFSFFVWSSLWKELFISLEQTKNPIVFYVDSTKFVSLCLKQEAPAYSIPAISLLNIHYLFFTCAAGHYADHENSRP